MANEKLNQDSLLITDATIINEGVQTEANVLIKNGIIWNITPRSRKPIADKKLSAAGRMLLPGVIDDQVHFREPGLVHKGNIYTESRAAIAGGITSFMEMPNTLPSATTNELLEAKFSIAAINAHANYSFFMGATPTNLPDLMAINPRDVCGVKIFMGSSTGNLLVDEPNALEAIFSEVPWLIATHCEDDNIILRNLNLAKERFGEKIPVSEHPNIRSREACYASSSRAVALAKKHGTRLHVLHISTSEELELFSNTLPLEQKKITAEACVHHLWFCDADYDRLGMYLKWNPAVKTAADRDAIREAVKNNLIDVVATDHAPHTIAEKEQEYSKAPSGGPLVQHSLLAMLAMADAGVFSIEEVVQKMSHNPAILFRIAKRGFIREGYFADLVMVEPKIPNLVTKESLLYHCGWSPFVGQMFDNKVVATLVNGNVVFYEDKFTALGKGMRLNFEV